MMKPGARLSINEVLQWIEELRIPQLLKTLAALASLKRHVLGQLTALCTM